MIKDKNLDKRAIKRFLTIESDFQHIHNFKYDYTNVIYYGFKKEITINCEKHGDFKVTPKHHLEGHSCPICSQEKQYGHITISNENLKLYKNLLLEYLSNKYPYFDFENFHFNENKLVFKCKKHGEISNTRISCNKCNLEYKEYKKLQTITKLVKYRIKNTNEKIISIKYNEIILECTHGKIITYKNSQIYNGNILCKKCRPHSGYENKISQEEFIKRSICRLGNNWGIENTTYIKADVKIPLYCEKHGEFYIFPSNYLKGAGCPKCSIKNASSYEKEIADFIQNCEISNRRFISPYEIDVFNDKFGVEFDGILWHSIGKHKSVIFNNYNIENKLKYRHLHKTELCENKGLQLFHIFEDEFLNNTKKEIWKSVLKNKLGESEKLYARKCSIKEISNSEYKSFCENNHLQGYGLASIKIGLFYQEELVSLMSFGKSRYSKNTEYELIRYCSKLNTQVIGGASRLLKYFERTYQPKSIISYANRRWSQGLLYETLGFEFSHNSEPNYFYFLINENILYSRVQFQKHKLKDKLEIYDSKLSETENMFNNGYRKIYDCGNKVYIKNY